MRFGLSEENINLIINCLKTFSVINWVKIYGSRAVNNYRRGSDIDLDYSASKDISASLKDRLEALPMPYCFDIIHYETLNNQKLKESIDRDGEIFVSFK